MWHLNVKSNFFLIKESYELLLASKEKGGAANICVMSSNNGKYPFHPIGIYSMTKAALDNMV
jgi:NAD(P)-dependent dehydrogenase (short-subunit alcohol dehydrogenase family)